MLTLRKLDLTGICIGLVGGSTAPFYYGFYCKEMAFFRNLWIGIVWVCCFLALLFTMTP